MKKYNTLSLWIVTGILALIIAGFIVQPVVAQNDLPLTLVLTTDGPLTSSMLEYLKRGLRTAEQRGAALIIFEINTPGGSTDLMDDMVAQIRGSSIPVVVYVTPRGALAGSAGTVITLAGHAAAMAPETAIGAASPVGGQGEDLGETLETKLKEIIKAQVRSLAERRGPEAVQLAEETIESAKAVTSTEALEVGLIDFIANDLADLLRQLDGYTVETVAGEKTLATTGGSVTHLNPSLIEQILQILTNPNIVFLLITIGVQSILIEISSPGGWAAGFIGIVCLSLATYGLGVLPVNWFGLIFIIMAFVLFVLDIKAPTHGALTAAGVGSLIVGALVLFNSPGVPAFQRVSVPLIVGTSMATGAMFFAVLFLALRARSSPILTGQESFIGRTGTARSDLEPGGTVQVGSELWTAELVDRKRKLAKGGRVEVVRVKGVKLYVRQVE